ncbi:MAG: hypothetical protein HRT36_01630 [Alphaproteobacteria bacterium]|nr:hypothetical protein [Alphaproteobacteria bacterium]
MCRTKRDFAEILTKADEVLFPRSALHEQGFLALSWSMPSALPASVTTKKKKKRSSRAKRPIGHNKAKAAQKDTDARQIQ